jgi:hypothetical protein
MSWPRYVRSRRHPATGPRYWNASVQCGEWRQCRLVPGLTPRPSAARQSAISFDADQPGRCSLVIRP